MKANRKHIQIQTSALLDSVFISALTCLSAVLFALHYCSTVGKRAFLKALAIRFYSRSVISSAPFSKLFSGYLKSFLYVWLALAFLALLSAWQYKGLAWIKADKLHERKRLFFVMTFPLLENLIMKQHAIQYPFDRMKLVFPLIFIICDLVCALLKSIPHNSFRVALCACLTCLCIANYHSYTNDSSYIWNAPYEEDNQTLAQYLNDFYSDSVMGVQEFSIRGYANLTFNRGIYEWTTPENLIELCAVRGKRYAILLEADSIEPWNVTDFGGARIWDVWTGNLKKVTVRDGVVDSFPIQS